MAINNQIDIGSAPILWSNVKHAFTIVNDNFSNINLNDLTDVDTETNPLSVGDVLTWTGEQWEPIVSGGVAAAAGIGWTIDGNNDQFRISTTFTELNEEYNIRAVRINNDGLLEVEIAVFNPIISVPTQTLQWDEPATEFTVIVDNPNDFTTKYISAIAGISNVFGIHDIIDDYDTTGAIPTPIAGGDWVQVFYTNATATISSNGSGLNGGSASADIRVVDENNDIWGDPISIDIMWNNANNEIHFVNLLGQNFLGKYNSIDYIVDIFGIADNNNAISTVSSSDGALSNDAGTGTMTFAIPLHKDNNFNRQINVSTEFTRPASVTGTQYSETVFDVDGTISAEFTYPTFYTWTGNVFIPPIKDDIVDGNDFSPNIVQLGNQVKNMSTFIGNLENTPLAFWFAVRSNATQPTVFETGPSASLLSTVDVTFGNTILLEPDIPDPDYIPEEYTLYGITLQPGNTYVRIN